MKHSYSKDVQAISAALEAKHGTVKPEWQALIKLADEQFALLEKCNATIEKTGILDTKTFKKNPLIASKKDIIASLLKIYQQLGVTPWSESKVKADNSDADEALLKNIMGD